MIAFRELKTTIESRYFELKGCGANKPGGGGFSAGNTCARGGKSIVESNLEKRYGDAVSQMRADAAETQKLYGNPSQSEGAKSHTQSKPVRYGVDKYDNEWHPLAKPLQQEVLNSPLVQNETLYRGVRDSYASSLLSKNVGDTITIEAFASTSRSKSVAETFTGGDIYQGKRAMLIIDAPKGSKALYVHDLASEFLLPAFAQLKVTRKEGTIIYAKYKGVKDPFAEK